MGVADEVAVQGSAAPSRVPGLIAGGLSFAVFLAVFLLSFQIHSAVDSGGVTPSWWPQVLTGSGMVVSALLVVLAAIGKGAISDEVGPATRTGLLRVLGSAAVLIAFLTAWPVVGFYIAAPIAIVVLLLLFGVRSIRGIAIYLVLVMGLVYLLFTLLLRVPL